MYVYIKKRDKNEDRCTIITKKIPEFEMSPKIQNMDGGDFFILLIYMN